MDYAICPKCKRLTDVSDKQAENNPNEPSECNECGKLFDAAYADFLDKDELESKFDALLKRWIADQKAGKKITATKEESATFELYFKHIGKIV